MGLVDCNSNVKNGRRESQRQRNIGNVGAVIPVEDLVPGLGVARRSRARYRAEDHVQFLGRRRCGAAVQKLSTGQEGQEEIYRRWRRRRTGHCDSRSSSFDSTDWAGEERCPLDAACDNAFQVLALLARGTMIVSTLVSCRHEAGTPPAMRIDWFGCSFFAHLPVSKVGLHCNKCFGKSTQKRRPFCPVMDLDLTAN